MGFFFFLRYSSENHRRKPISHEYQRYSEETGGRGYIGWLHSAFLAWPSEADGITSPHQECEIFLSYPLGHEKILLTFLEALGADSNWNLSRSHISVLALVNELHLSAQDGVGSHIQMFIFSSLCVFPFFPPFPLLYTNSNSRTMINPLLSFRSLAWAKVTSNSPAWFGEFIYILCSGDRPHVLPRARMGLTKGTLTNIYGT